MTIWYSISIQIPTLTSQQIFNGYFSVEYDSSFKEIITGFYETINGLTNFSNNILGNSGSTFDSSNMKFSSIYPGTILSYIYYFNNPASPHYSNTYTHSNLSSQNNISKFTYNYSDTTPYTVNANYGIRKLSSYTCAVIYNGNGNTSGSAPYGSLTISDSDVKVDENTGKLEKTDYNFTGWNTKADGSGTSYLPGSTFTITASTTLFAQWTPVLYTVTYDGNGNTSGTVPASTTYPSGSTVTVLGNTGSLVKTNYFFAGWNTNINTSSGAGTRYLPGSTFIIKGTTRLFAEWSPPLFSVNVFSNIINSFIFTGYIKVNENNLVTEVYQTSPTPTDPFTNVLGAINSVLTVKTTAKNDNIGSFTTSGVLINPSPPFNNETSITIYNFTDAPNNYQVQINYPNRVETPNSLDVYYQKIPVDNLYKLVYNGNGNTSGSAPNGSFNTGGSTVTVLNTGSLEKTNYNFTGWNTKVDGSGSKYDPGNSFIINENTTLYAQWSPSWYKVVAISGNFNEIFSGYIKVNSANLVIGAYKTDIPPPYSNSPPVPNIIGDINTVYTYLSNSYNDNKYDPTTGLFSANGVLINSTFYVGQDMYSSMTLYNFTNSKTYRIQLNGAVSVTYPLPQDYYTVTPVKYKITYNGNGNTSGLPPVDSNSYLYDSPVTILGYGTLIKIGYPFAGWNTEADGSGSSYLPGSTFTIITDTTLYAQYNAWFKLDVVNYGDAAVLFSGYFNINVTMPGAGNIIPRDVLGVYKTNISPPYSYSPPVPNILGTIDSVLIVKTGKKNDNKFYFAPSINQGLFETGVLINSKITYGQNTWESMSLYNYNDGSNIYRVQFNGSNTSTPSIQYYRYNAILVSYSITYNGNGNTSGSGTIPIDGSSPYLYGSTVTVLDTGSLVKTNYTFSNWNTKIDGTGLSYLPTSQFTITADTTLYAQWTPVLYTVTYDGNGNTSGTVPAAPTTYQSGSTVPVLGNTGSLVKTGFVFNGWNTTANGSGSKYDPGNTFTITADTILYAQWAYTVTYDGNGNTGGTVPTDSTFYQPSSLVIVLGNTGSLVRTNYFFTGWNTKANGSGLSYLPDSTFTINADTTLFAQWTPLYTVTYNGNGNTGGTVPTDSTFYQPGSSVTVLNIGSLVKTNSTFSNWNTKANGSGSKYDPGNSFIINENTTLYAQWTNTIRYNRNGADSGTIPVDTLSPYLSGSTVTVLGNTGPLVKTGFVFNGWNTAANGSGSKYDPGNTFIINENTILYAQWAITVTYDGNGNTGGTVPVDTLSPYLSGSTVRVLGSETLVKTNATFSNWNTKKDGSGTSYFQFNTFTITANIILYAQWISAYTVTYNGNTNTSGSVPIDLSSPYVNNSLVTVLGNTGSLAKTGYFFSGWNTNANGTGLSYSPANTFNINANITLYAQFTSIPVPSYSITYNGNINNGGTVPIDGLSPYISSSTITVLGNTGSLTKSGYIFTGWNTKSDGTGISYTPSNTFIINANITLYAKWTSDTFSYYQNNLKDNTGKIIFSGYFKVRNSNNLITEFYQTIDGNTDLTKNILIDVDSQETFFSNPSSVFNDNIYNSNNNEPFTNGGVAVTPNLVISGNTVSVLTLHYSILSDRVTPVRATFIYGTGSNGFRIKGRNALGVQGVPVAPNGYGYTLTPIQNPVCFNEGTKILCLNKQFEEEYIPIEHLRKGDLVKSYKHGYRRIDLIGKNSMINDPNRFTNCMYKMEKTAENGLIEDLIITGGHSILVDDLEIYKEKNDKIFGSTLMVDDKYLLLSAVSNDFKKIENVNLYTYYHFTLENDGDDNERFGVWANGILTETPSKNYFTKNFIAS